MLVYLSSGNNLILTYVLIKNSDLCNQRKRAVNVTSTIDPKQTKHMHEWFNEGRTSNNHTMQEFIEWVLLPEKSDS